MKIKSVIDKVYSVILRSKKGLSSRQIILKCDGIGDPTRRCRELQNEGLITSKWNKRKINGKMKHYKVYSVVR